MGGRGRGRGKQNFSFDVGSLGFGRGEALPSQCLQPPLTYPPMEKRPHPLSLTDVDGYLLALSQEYRGNIKDSPFYLKSNTIRGIHRYTDRYKQQNHKADIKYSEPNWAYFPGELKPSLGKRRTSRNNHVKPVIRTKANDVTKNGIGKEDVEKKLEELVEKESSEGVGVVEDGEVQEEVQEEEEEEFEEEVEDDNDYNFDHYDDGGDRYGEAEEGEDGPVY